MYARRINSGILGEYLMFLFTKKKYAICFFVQISWIKYFIYVILFYKKKKKIIASSMTYLTNIYYFSYINNYFFINVFVILL